MEILRKNITEGVFLTALKTDKFKTNRIYIDIVMPLMQEHVSENALFPAVLLRGTKAHPNLLSLQRALSSLYGADIDYYIGTYGEAQVVTLYAKFLRDKFAPDGEKIAENVGALLKEALTSPVTENGAFSAGYVESEKDKLRDDIAAAINDKDAYALRRLITLMCEGEAWGISELGTAEAVDSITPDSLYKRYTDVLKEAHFEIFFIGDFEENFPEEFTRSVFDGIGRVPSPDFSTKKKNAAAQVRRFTEHQNIAQGKLVLGFRTPTSAYDDDFTVFTVMNAVFGGTDTSKLFLNVRERLSLCYHCSSRLYSKGVIIVTSGIEKENRDTATKEILSQLENIKNGIVTEEELCLAKKKLINSARAIGDSAASLHSFHSSNAVFGRDETPEEKIAKIERVTLADIIEAAKTVTLDTEYFLCAGEEDE